MKTFTLMAVMAGSVVALASLIKIGPSGPVGLDSPAQPPKTMQCSYTEYWFTGDALKERRVLQQIIEFDNRSWTIVQSDGEAIHNPQGERLEISADQYILRGESPDPRKDPWEGAFPNAPLLIDNRSGELAQHYKSATDEAIAKGRCMDIAR